MKTTTNLGLKKIELTDSPPDITVQDANWDLIDKHLYSAVNYQKAGGTGTALTLNEVTLTDGFSKTFIVTVANGGAATTINGKSMYKPGGTLAPNLIAGKAYTIWYNTINDCFYVLNNVDDIVAYTHPASGISAGTYRSVTVNTNGHVTAGTNPTTLTGYGISDATPSSHIGATGTSVHGVATTSVAGFMSTTDKSKLDGIEAGATADMTASEILTAIKTVDGAGSGLDADLLDGQTGSYYLDYNNFTNKPISLPANGGNADTVDSKHASDFMQKFTRVASTVDANTLLTAGCYGMNGSNPNVPGGGYGTLLVLPNEDTGMQIYGGHSSDVYYLRGWSGSGTVWTSWRKMYTNREMTISTTVPSSLTDGVFCFVYE